MRIKFKSELVAPVALSAVLWLSVAVSAPSDHAAAASRGASSDPWNNAWNSVAAGAVVVGGSAATLGGVLLAGQQAVIDNPAARGDDRALAVARMPVATAVVVVGGTLLVTGVAVAVWQALQPAAAP